MIIDKRATFADGTSAALGLGLSALIGDVYDRRAATTNPNVVADQEGSDIYLVIQVKTTFVGATSTTRFELSSDSTENLATSRTIHFVTPTFPVASLVAGALLACVRLPSGSYERYIGIFEVNGVAAVTAGNINAFLTIDPALYRAYGDNVA